MLAVSSAPLLIVVRGAPPWRALTSLAIRGRRKNGRPLFMNKDALDFLKRGRGGAPSYLDALRGEAAKLCLKGHEQRRFGLCGSYDRLTSQAEQRIAVDVPL